MELRTVGNEATCRTMDKRCQDNYSQEIWPGVTQSWCHTILVNHSLQGLFALALPPLESLVNYGLTRHTQCLETQSPSCHLHHVHSRRTPQSPRSTMV